MRKKKKSLVGWTHSNWFEAFQHTKQKKSYWKERIGTNERIYPPIITSKPKPISSDGRSRKKNLKVRITIQEI